MPTVVVDFTNYRIEGANVTVPGSVVGADPWDDEDDGSYTVSTESLRAFRTVDWAVADIPPIPDLVTVTGASLFIRMSMTNTGNTGAPLQASVAFINSEFDELSYFTAPGEPFGVISVDTESTIYEITDAVWDAADIAAELRDGCSLVVLRQGNDGDSNPADYTVTTYKLTLTLTYTGGTPAPPWRLFPRDDNLGNSPRLFPRPTTRQRSNRISGTW